MRSVADTCVLAHACNANRNCHHAGEQGECRLHLFVEGGACKVLVELCIVGRVAGLFVVYASWPSGTAGTLGNWQLAKGIA